ncbi:MAG: glycosyltransferase family 2 protein [Vicinamibacterales bacterium]
MAADTPITVVVCTRNRAHYLPTCLESLARQTCDTPFEVLVVDNASTDDTARVLREWAAGHTRFRAVVEPRLGQSAAKNTGVRLARGSLLLFTDDDVVLDSRWVQSYVDFFDGTRRELIVAGGPIIPVPHDLGNWPDWFDACAMHDVGLLDYGEERPLRSPEYLWGANMAMPASVFGSVGLWNEQVGHRGEERGTFEDTEYQDRLRQLGGVTWFCPAARLQHRIPLQHVTPSRVLTNAYRRGRNQFWKDVADRRAAGRDTIQGHRVRALSALLGRCAALLFWAVAFRCRAQRAVFIRTRRAAWSSGWAMDAPRLGRESTRASRLMGRAALFVLAAAAKVLPRE